MVSEEVQDLIEHAIAKTLVLCGTLVAIGSGKKLATIGGDPKLSKRASKLILNRVLRELVSRDEMTRKQFRRLLDEVVALANES